MNYLISDKTKDSIREAILKSVIPSVDAQNIALVLDGLKPEVIKKDEPVESVSTTG